MIGKRTRILTIFGADYEFSIYKHSCCKIRVRFNQILKFCCLVLILSAQSCFIKSEIEYYEKEPDFSEYVTTVTGFSGMCETKDKVNFLAVSDKLGVYEISRSGGTIRKLPVENGHDFEAITINPATGEIYLADEGQMKIFKLLDDETTLKEIAKVAVDGGLYNKGIEGLAFGRDTLYIVNQDSPALLIKYSLKSNTEVSRIKLNFGGSFSEVFYDATDNSLWFCDSVLKKIYHTSLTGILKSSQDIAVIAKPEALIVDRKSKFLWVGCDQTLFLYKIKLTIN